MITCGLSACADPPRGIGAPRQATAPAEGAVDPDKGAPRGADAQSTPGATESGSTPGAPGDEKDTDGVPRPGGQAAGSITLSWTGGAEHQNFEYDAEHCYVGADYILVEGTGGPIGGSGESRIKIFTTPAELLHEATGTFQAEGSVRFTWDGDEIVADGRQIHVGDYPQPAVFTYRYTHDSAKYIVSWFRGAADAGAGAVEIACAY